MKEGAYMTIDTNSIVSVTGANQNFSRVTRIAEKNGQAVIFKEEMVTVGLVVADGSMNYEKLRDWVARHRV